jgi:hypothetical protein
MRSEFRRPRVRAFGDGFVALLLPIYLLDLDFSALAIGAIVSGTLVGTAVLTPGRGQPSPFPAPSAACCQSADGGDGVGCCHDGVLALSSLPLSAQ